MANAIAAVGVAVSDLKRSAAFYTRVVGMKEQRTIELENMDEIILAGERGAAVVLMQYKDGVKRDLGAGAGKVVFNVDDIAGAVARAREAGGAVTREPATVPSMGDAMIGFVTDPDGVTLELIQQPRAR
jgi:lactoylglutathione lyase